MTKAENMTQLVDRLGQGPPAVQLRFGWQSICFLPETDKRDDCYSSLRVANTENEIQTGYEEILINDQQEELGGCSWPRRGHHPGREVLMTRWVQTSFRNQHGGGSSATNSQSRGEILRQVIENLGIYLADRFNRDNRRRFVDHGQRTTLFRATQNSNSQTYGKTKATNHTHTTAYLLLNLLFLHCRNQFFLLPGYCRCF